MENFIKTEFAAYIAEDFSNADMWGLRENSEFFFNGPQLHFEVINYGFDHEDQTKVEIVVHIVKHSWDTTRLLDANPADVKDVCTLHFPNVDEYRGFFRRLMDYHFAHEDVFI